MKLRDLVKKVEQLNELNKEFGMDKEVFIHIKNDYNVDYDKCNTWEEVKEQLDYETYKYEIDNTELEKQGDEYIISTIWKVCGHEFKFWYSIEVY